MPLTRDTRGRDTGREALYGDLHQRLQGLVDRVCPASLLSFREDLAQEAVLRLLRAEKATTCMFVPTHTYLARVVRSVLIDKIRYRSVRRSEIARSASELEELARATSNPEIEARSRECLRKVAECILQVAPDRRRAVDALLDGLSISESSRRLDCSRKRVENLRHRGMADLRATLRDSGVGPDGVESQPPAARARYHGVSKS